VVEAVVCCSGCFAAYRRGAVTPILEGWENQRFLGVDCTYGDDRALTNMVIRTGWKTIYDETAEAWTDAPAQYRTFFRQQLRWKKSWVREGPILLSHIWRTRARAFPFVLIATIAGLLSPFILIHNIVGIALGGRLPLFYLMGLYLVALAYALFYRSVRNDGLWTDAFIGTFFYTVFSPQLIWAALRVRDGRWGTRAEADAEAVVPVSSTFDNSTPDHQVPIHLESAR
jgi:hyaluronan synthase